MDTQGSITCNVRALASGIGREDAARVLWDRFYRELTRHALRRLQAMHCDRAAADEEDAATRAFAKVCRGIESGQLQLAGRDDLRALLLWCTRCEVINQASGGAGVGRPTAAADGAGAPS